MRDHTKLRAFELADEVAILTYQVTARFPKEELYGLVSQMRRACRPGLGPTKLTGCNNNGYAQNYT